MMSVAFDRTANGGDGESLRADHASNLVPSFPFSVSLWVRFDEVPEQTQTVWFYGDKDVGDKYTVLEAVAVGGGAAALRARMQNGGTSGPTTSNSQQIPVSEWCLVTVVADKDDSDNVTLTLYLNDESPVSASQTVQTTHEDDYDRFMLGRFGASGFVDRAQRGRRAA